MELKSTEIKSTQIRILRSFWVSASGLFLIVSLIPINNRLTRASTLVLFVIIWFGVIADYWRYRTVRFSLLCLTALVAGFLVSPSRSLPTADSFRNDYVAGLRHYQDVTYCWGGESLTGIDCSGLIRRGLIDALFCRGIRTLDPGLVRRSFSLWWHDCTAKALGEARDGVTTHLLGTSSLNELDDSRLLPGDLAVTNSGVHIMAYLGDGNWIEADPHIGRVVIISAPSSNPYFQCGMTILRWSILQP